MLKNAVWITGAKGSVGSYLDALLEKRGYEVLPTDVEVDVTDLEAVNEFAAKNRPVTVINCAALAGRTVSDADPTEAYRVNAIGARNVAIASASVGAKLVHLSTDDVFPQNLRTAVNEFDAPSPDCVYGKSKLAGENFVRRSTARTSSSARAGSTGWVGRACSSASSTRRAGASVRAS